MSHFRLHANPKDIPEDKPSLVERITLTLIEFVLGVVTIVMLALVLMPTQAHAQSADEAAEDARREAVRQQYAMEYRMVEAQRTAERQAYHDERTRPFREMLQAQAQRRADRLAMEKTNPHLDRDGDRYGFCTEQTLSGKTVLTHTFRCNIDAMLRVANSKR